MTKKKQRHRLVRLLRGTGAPMAVAAKAARIASRTGRPSLYMVGLIAGGRYGESLADTMSALGFMADGRWSPCCTDPTHGDMFEPLGVAYVPAMITEEMERHHGDRTLHMRYPEGTRMVPTYTRQGYR